MTDRPILFSAPMVKALRAGRKFQTRRVLKPQPPVGARYNGVHFASDEPDSWFFNSPGGPFKVPAKCELGDRLWVREAWRVSRRHDAVKPSDLAPRTMTVFFEAGGSIANQESPADWRPSEWPTEAEGRPEWAGRLRPGMFMPRWSSRLTLTVTDVRVQQLQEISEEDAKAEGVEPLNSEREEHDWSICPQCGGTCLYNGLGANLGVMPDCDCYECDTHRKRFHHLWSYLHGPGAWDANPWVAAYSFETRLGNIDEEGP